jgi:hypothetical protein
MHEILKQNIMIYQSETIDYTYLSLEIKDGHGVLYETYQRNEVFDTTYVTDVYTSDDSQLAEYDADLDWWQEEFLKGLFTNIKKI